jgi:hypothetical protein
LLNIFWTMLEFFLWVAWIYLLVLVVFDIFRSHDLSGWAKALWILFVFIIPFIGVLVYLIARGGGLHERSERQDEAFRSELPTPASGSSASSADQLTKLADLRDRGVITADEFEREKAKILA